MIYRLKYGGVSPPPFLCLQHHPTMMKSSHQPSIARFLAKLEVPIADVPRPSILCVGRHGATGPN
jgi:hypothetical protein